MPFLALTDDTHLNPGVSAEPMGVELRRSLTCSPWAAIAQQRTALSTGYRAGTIPALRVHGKADVNVPIRHPPRPARRRPA